MVDLTGAQGSLTGVSLEAGSLRVASALSEHQLADDEQLAPTLSHDETPWGTVSLVRIADAPARLAWLLDGVEVAALHANGQYFTSYRQGALGLDGTAQPARLGEWTGSWQFLAEGSRLRPAGRTRYVRVEGPPFSWTFHHAGADGHGARFGPRRLFGDPQGHPVLQRGTHPHSGEVVVSVQYAAELLPEAERTPHRQEQYSYTFSWPEGTLLAEVALAHVLTMGIGAQRFAPLYERATAFGMELGARTILE